MIIFLSESEYVKVSEELSLKDTSTVPKWSGTQRIRDLFKTYESDIEFDGRILRKGNIVGSLLYPDKCGFLIDDDVIQDISNSKNCLIFWNIFSCFSSLTDDNYNDIFIQENNMLNFLNRHTLLKITKELLNIICDYCILSQDLRHAKITTLTKCNILNGTHSRYRDHKLYGKHKGKIDSYEYNLILHIDNWIKSNNILNVVTQNIKMYFDKIVVAFNLN